MKPWPYFRFRISVLAFVLALAAIPASLGFNDPLSPEAIREAYFLGVGSYEKRAELLEKYVQHPPALETGPDVGAIEVETPFTCIVEAMTHKPMGYHAPDAEQDFLGKPGCFKVRVQIYFTSTYPDAKATSVTLGDFWRDFQIHLKQKKEIESRSVQGMPIYSDETISGYIGADILVDYDEKKIDPGSPATVKVVTPDGQEVEATFDLGSLR